MSGIIIYSPETMTYTLSNGTDRITLPNWARRVIGDEFEREVRPLSNKIEILSDALELSRTENAKLRKLFNEFWAWADPPFALDSGTFDEFMAIVEQARELGLEV